MHVRKHGKDGKVCCAVCSMLLIAVRRRYSAKSHFSTVMITMIS
jgi:hypothetical protein